MGRPKGKAELSNGLLISTIVDNVQGQKASPTRMVRSL